jgi:hypothetical protein
MKESEKDKNKMTSLLEIKHHMTLFDQSIFVKNIEKDNKNDLISYQTNAESI